MSYTAKHDPAHARVAAVLGGFVATWYWPERPVSGKPLSQQCTHLHRTRSGATRCAQSRTATVEQV